MRAASLSMSSRVLRFHPAVALLAAVAALLPAPCRALALPDLVAESVSADALTRECVTAEVSGLIGAVVRNDSVQPVTVATRVLFFEDSDLNGAYDPARDTLLGEAPLPPLGALARSVVTATISAEMSFSGAPIHLLVDSGQAVTEGSESNNVVSSAMPPLAPPCQAGPAAPFAATLRETLLPSGYLAAYGATATVLVTHLTDDTGDGIHDDRDDPTLLAHVNLNDGRLSIAAYRGTTGELLFMTPDSDPAAGYTRTREFADFAVGNLDGDPEPEFVAQFAGGSQDGGFGQLMAFDNKGNWIWTSDGLPRCPPPRPPLLPYPSTGCVGVGHGTSGAPIIANLDGRGYPEIIFGATVLSNRGKLLADAPLGGGRGAVAGDYPSSPANSLSAVADIDLDGDLELVAGGTVYSFDAGGLHVERQIWGLDGWVGIANFDDDDEAEVVVVSDDEVWLLNVTSGPPTGSGGLDVLLSWSPPGGYGDDSWWKAPLEDMGPPTLRDLDGDGAPEILISTGARFGAIKVVNLVDGGDPDLPRVLWKIPINAGNAKTLGSTAFDLDGDGQPEVLHQDQQHFRILDGLTGDEKFIEPSSAWGGFQTPVVADIDNDGHAEVLVASRGNPWVGEVPLRGIQVFGDENWMPARSAWNQHMYSVTNISDNGAVQRSPVPHWLVPAGNPISDFKCQRSPDLAASCRLQADLTVSRVRSSAPPCGTSVQLRAVVGNAGSAPTIATIATLYSGDPSLGNARGTADVPALLPGQSHEVAITVSGEPIFEAVVVVDDEGLVVESDENNNACQAPVGRTCSPAWERKETNLVYEGLWSGHHHDPVEMIARLSDADDPAAPGVADVFVNFELGTGLGLTCRALTDADGRARCWLTPTAPAGSLALTATSDPTPHWFGATAQPGNYIVGLEETTLVFDAPLVQPAWWHQVEATATLREDGALGLGSEQLSFGPGGTPPAATTASSGQATLTLSGVPHGDQNITATFAGTNKHVPVTLTTSVHVLGAQVMATPLAQAGIAGATHQVTATALNDGTPRAGHLMAFRLLPGSVSGSVSGTCVPPTCRTDAAGSAGWEYTSAAVAGIDTVRAWLDLVENGVQDADEPFADVTVHLRVERATAMSFTTLPADLKSDYSDARAVTARLQELGGPVVVGEAIEISLGSDACRGETNASGELTCWFTPTLPATVIPAAITASFAGNSVLAPVSHAANFTIEHEETRLILASYSFTWAGSVRLFVFRAKLTGDGALPLEGREVIFSAGSMTDSGTTGSDGVAEGLLLLPDGAYTVTASFAGDDYYEAVTAPSAQAVVVGPATPSSFSWVASIAPTPTPVLNDAIARSDGTVEVTFTPGTGSGAAFVTGFLITVDGTSKVSVSKAELAATPPTSRFITRLSNGGAPHSFTVTAVNDAGPGAISGSDSATPVTIPGPPASVTATPLPVSNEIEVAWVDGDDGGSPPIQHGDVLSLPVGTVLEPATNPQFVAATDGVPYSFRVRLKNSAGHGPWSPVTPDVLLGEPPSAPRDLRATPGDTFVKIYWTQPEFLNGGEIQNYIVTKDGIDLVPPLPPDQVTLTVSGPNGTPMSFKVVARNAFGAGMASDPVTTTPFGVPDRPAAVVSTGENGAAWITWTDGTDGGSPLTGHVAGRALSPLTSPEPAPGASKRIVTSLLNGVDVELSAGAVNARGSSGPLISGIVRPARHPDQPTTVLIGTVGNQEVTIGWTHPGETGSQQIIKSKVTCEPDCGEREVLGAATLTVDNLVNGQPYVFFVRGVNETLPEPGTESEPSLKATPRTVPGTPRSFRLAVCGDTRLCATWAAPASDGGAPIDRYDLSCTSSNGGPQLDVQPVAGARRHVFTSGNLIEPGDTYTCSITAHNEAGSSLIPTTAGPVTVATLPQAPSIGVPSAGDGTASLTWTDLDPGLPSGYADIIGYRVCPIPGGGDCVEVGGDQVTGTVSDLSNGNAYKLEVRARNIVGLGPPRITLESVIPCARPSAPTMVTARPVLPGTLEVSWPPAWSGGCDVQYDVMMQPGGTILSAGPDLSLIVSGLITCTAYTFTVRGHNAAGDGPWSAASSPMMAAVAPDPPLDVKIIPGDTCALVRWKRPAYEGCAPITYYRITLSGQPPVWVTAAAECVLVRDLSNTATYDVEIVAVNAAGTSLDGAPTETVAPTPPTLDSIEFETNPVVGGDETIAYVQLAGVANPDGTTVTIVSLNGGVAWSLPATHVAVCGESRVPVPIATNAVGSTTVVTFIAHLAGSPDVSADLTVTGPGGGAGTGGSDCLVRIDSPGDGSDVTNFGTEVSGTISCAGGAGPWSLELCPSDSSAPCVSIGSGSGNASGVLGTIDPTLLLNGEYMLRLDVPGVPNALAEHSITITGQQKIGNFSVSFVDMTVPAAGTPIQVIRTYDSRDTRLGDFGVGWRLAFSDVRIERLRPLDDHWSLVTHGDLGAWGVTQRCYEEDWAHIISVIFPDGKTYKFRPTLSRAMEGAQTCGWDNGGYHGWMQYVPVGANRGKLLPTTPNPSSPGEDPRRVGIDLSDMRLYWEDGDDDFLSLPDPAYAPTSWSLETEDGRIWNVTEGVGLTSVEDRNGNTLTFTPFGITSNSGPSVTIQRVGNQPDGLVTKIIDPAGRYLRYKYEAAPAPTDRLWKVYDRIAAASAAGSEPYWTEFGYADAHGLPYHVNRIQQMSVSGSSTPPPYTKSYYDPNDNGRLQRTCMVRGGIENCVDLATRDLAGHSQTIRDLRDHSTTLHYDERGNVTTRSDAAGNPWTTTYTADDQPLVETDPRLIKTAYAYDGASGNVTRVTSDALGLAEKTDYTWGEKRTLLSIDTEEMAPNTFQYDTKGNLRLTRDPAGHETVLECDSAGNVRHTEDALGHETFTTFVWSSPVEEIDAAGVVTNYEYDSNLNPLRIARQLEDGEQVTEHVYDAENRIIRTTAADGAISETVYDDYGRVWKQRERVSLPTATEPNGVYRETETVHDEYGRVKMMRYPDGTATLTLHDLSSNVIREESRVPRDAAGVPTAPATQPDPPTITRHGYDALDREYKTCFGEGVDIDFDEPWELGCTWKSFDDAGRLLIQVDERGYATTFDYDNANRRTKTCGPSGQSDGTPFPASTNFAALTCADVAPDIETAYDRDGRVLSSKVPGLAFQVPHHDAAGRREFDCRHLPGQQADPPDDPRDAIDIPGITCRAFETDALGRVIAETDEDGHRTAFAFDEVGRLVSVTDARGKVTRYEFDDRGSMVSQTDALERVTRYEQDSAGRRVARVLPMLQRETFAYTVTGALRQHVDFLGRTTTHDIDDDTDRIDSTNLPSVAGLANVTFDYYGDGTRRRVTDEAGQTTYDREPLRGQLASVDRPDVPALGYTYDPDSGERLGVQTADDSTDVAYEHDAAGRLWKVREQGILRATYMWDDAGRVSKLVYGATAPGELEGLWTYDELTGGVETITWKLPGVGGTELLRLDYELDDTNGIADDEEGSGRRTGVTETWVAGPTRRIDYTFDELHRLTDEHELRGTATRHVQYQYDDVGNRVQRSVTVDAALVEDISHSYDANDRLLSAGTTFYEWDANGNLTSKDSGEYNWDDQDRLTDAEGWVFAYDVDGLKQSSDPPADGITRHVVDTTFPYAQVLEDRSPAGITNYLRGSQPIRLTRSGQSWWYLHDALGSTRALVSAGGTLTVTDEWDYEAFGGETRRVGTTENRWLYAGEERNEGIALDYLRARWMDPQVGRFASRDTAEGAVTAPGTRQAYAYASGDPIMWTDPSGHESLAAQMTATSIASFAFASGVTIGGYRAAEHGVRSEGEADWASYAAAFREGFGEGFFGGALLLLGAPGARSGAAAALTRAQFLRFATSEAAEEYAASRILGSKSQYRLETSRGDRVVDVWDPAARKAIEVKTGYQNTPGRLEEQILKDVELRDSQRIAVEWHFYENGEGVCGMSKRVRELLDAAEIPVIFHSLRPIIGR